MSTIESIRALTTDVNAASPSGQGNGASTASLPPTEGRVKGFKEYESVLVRSHSTLLSENLSSSQGEMAKASTDKKFKAELDTIESCESLYYTTYFHKGNSSYSYRVQNLE